LKGYELWSNAAGADADNNGWIDVYVNQVYVQQPNSFAHLYMNEGGTFAERHADLPVSLWGGYGSAWADLDSDGRMDLLAAGATAVNGPRTVHVLHNRTREAPWVGFIIQGRQGLVTTGTRVLLVQKDQVQVRQVEATMGSHTQQNDRRLHFGLGSGGKIEDVVVYWPDGVMASLGRPKVGRYHLVEREKTQRVRLTKVAPARATAGKEVTLRASGPSGRATYYWCLDGTRRVTEITRKPSLRYTPEQAGSLVGLVRAVTSRGGAAECSFTLEVREP